ncbi:DUF3317 superfamily protein [Histoplasma capsulatum]|uniref:DUF3317 superfamily protein n=1 Tax=Ajellomyces capsulatus TaxID=5037 RepID=A0A8A1M3J9_AJECA|nr:DUF3317 superfamily protein [Histoplasma capsulatum]
MATETKHFTSTSPPTFTSSPLRSQLTGSHNASRLQFNHLIKTRVKSASAPPASAAASSSSDTTSMSILTSYPYAHPVDDSAPIRHDKPSLLRRFTNRLQLAYYRYEVTYGIYVMTPEEKFVANTFLLVFISLLLWGLFLYFPPLLFQKLSRLAWILTGAGIDGVRERVSAELKLVNGSTGTGAVPCPGGPWSTGVTIAISPTVSHQLLPRS